ADAVLDHDRAPARVGHLLRHHAREHVGRAAGRGADDDPHGPGRVALSECERRDESEREGGDRTHGGSYFEVTDSCFSIGMTSEANSSTERSVSSSVRSPKANCPTK